VFTLAKRFDDEGEVEKAEEEDIEFLEAGEDSAEVFESPEEPLDFHALLVESAVLIPGLDAVGLWRNDRDHAHAVSQVAWFRRARRRDPSTTASLPAWAPVPPAGRDRDLLEHRAHAGRCLEAAVSRESFQLFHRNWRVHNMISATIYRKGIS
jgi:hypothetical protein